MKKRDFAEASAKIAAKVNAVKDLQKMGLLQEFTSEPYVYVYPQALRLKDKKYMKAWCGNIRQVWALNYPHLIKTSVNDIELTVFHKETGDFICRLKGHEIFYS